MKIKINQILNITSGEYEDYSIVESYVTLEEFDTDIVMEQYLQINPDEILTGEFLEGNFCEYLESQGYVQRIDIQEWHVADYDTPNRCGDFEMNIIDEHELIQGYDDGASRVETGDLPEEPDFDAGGNIIDLGGGIVGQDMY